MKSCEMINSVELTWWVGHSPERYQIKCPSRELAVQVASESADGAFIIEATERRDIRVSSYFDGPSFVLDADEAAWHEHGDPNGDEPIFMVTLEQCIDLQQHVRCAIDEWQRKHNLVFEGCVLNAVRDPEHIRPGTVAEVSSGACRSNRA